MLKHFYVEVDATDAQKGPDRTSVKQAVNDLMPPAFASWQSAAAMRMQALEQPTIDHASRSRRARAEHLQLGRCSSRSASCQLLGDVGDVLTPAQRQGAGRASPSTARVAAFLEVP